MNTVAVIAGVILAVAGVCTIWRIAKGPSLLDRVLAADVLLSILAGALAIDMAVNRHLDNLMLLISISMIGFIGSVVVARFVTDRRTSGG